MRNSPSTLRIRQFTALSALTAAEITRQPICLLLTASCVIMIGLAPLLMMFNFGENGKLVRDSALAMHLVFGLFVAGYAACSTLSGEMRKGTASAVLSKPVARSLFFLAKFAGVMTVVISFSAICIMAALLAEKSCEKFFAGGSLFGYFTDSTTNLMLIMAPFAAFAAAAFLNHRFRRPFQSTAYLFILGFLALVFILSGFIDEAGCGAPFKFRLDWRILPAGITVSFALATLSAIALCISSRLPLVPTLAILFAVFLAGLVSESFAAAAPPGGPAASLLNLIPDWQNFWVCDALNAGGNIQWSYVLNAGVYAALYSAAVLGIGIVSFSNADMK